MLDINKLQTIQELIHVIKRFDIYETRQVETTKSVISLEIYIVKTNVNVYELLEMHYLPVLFLDLREHSIPGPIASVGLGIKITSLESLNFADPSTR